MTYTICKTCNPQHYENCRTCFGFGVKLGSRGQNVPISAGSIKSITEWQACPECKSTPSGLPVQTKTEVVEKEDIK